MQSADDVQFRDAELQRLARLLDHLRNRQLETVGVAFLARERAELAGEDAVVRVVDVAVDDVAGAIADFLLSREISDCADGVQVLGFKQPQRVGVGNAFAGGDLVVKVAQFVALDVEVHRLHSKAAIVRQGKRSQLGFGMCFTPGCFTRTIPRHITREKQRKYGSKSEDD